MQGADRSSAADTTDAGAVACIRAGELGFADVHPALSTTINSHIAALMRRCAYDSDRRIVVPLAMKDVAENGQPVQIRSWIEFSARYRKEFDHL